MISVYSQSLSLLTQFNVWNTMHRKMEVNGRCCLDCQAHRYKLDHTPASWLKACSADAEGWCSREQRIITLINDVREAVANTSDATAARRENKGAKPRKSSSPNQ